MSISIDELDKILNPISEPTIEQAEQLEPGKFISILKPRTIFDIGWAVGINHVRKQLGLKPIAISPKF